MGKWFSLGGVPWNPPLCTNGSAGYLMQLSVKRVVMLLDFIFYQCIILRLLAFQIGQKFKKFQKLIFKNVTS